MKKYNFEYTDQKYSIKLLLLCLLLSGILTVIIFSLKPFGIFPSVLIIMGIPLTIFWFNKKKIKRQGSSKIYDSNIEFDIDGVQTNLNFSDIENYLVQVYNGTTLKIKVINGETLNIVANSNFCNPDEFYRFCLDFENTIEEYNKESTNSAITRKKTFFERQWVLPFLVIITVTFLVLIPYGLFKGSFKNTASLFMFIGSLLPLWVGYLSAKKRK